VVEPETYATVMDYDGAGNLAWSAAGLQSLMGTASCDKVAAHNSGRRVTRYHDARNRLSSLHFPDGRGNESWEYWPDGLPKKVTTENNGVGADLVYNQYAYNKRRLLDSETVQSQGGSVWLVSYGFDGNGSLASQSYPSGMIISYAPNALGQATQARDQSGYYYASGASYYPNGAIKQFTYGNGVAHSMTQNARQLPARVTDSGGVLDYDYGYDANGNIGHIYDYIPDLTPGATPKHRWMSYDGLDRLTSTGSVIFGGDHWHRFTYDAVDNMTSWKLAGVKDYATYVYDGRNQLGLVRDSSGAAVLGFGYDPQGNLQNKNGVIHDFDYGNRLRGVTGKEYYRYDAQGRRLLAWSPASGSIWTQYSLDGKQIYLESERTGNKEENVYLAGSIVATRVWNAATSYIAEFQHTDALGSPVAVTNQAGTVIERNDYEPYGAVIGKPNYQGIGYTGHVHDAATKLTYMQQRYYDPQVGLFLSVDPVTAYSNPVGMFNRYRYANSNPYKFSDPDGRQAKAIGQQQPTQEQMVPIPTLQKLQAAKDMAVPKSVYTSGSLAQARVGSPVLSATAEIGKATVSLGTEGMDATGSPGSARVDSPIGSYSTDGGSTSGVAAGNKVSGPGVGVGVSNATSAKVISNIPMTKLQIPLITVAWGSDSNGNWAVEASGGAKAQFGFERPKQED
jgi:RHS repeat-associated protein